MANIQVKDLYDQKVREFKMMGSGGARFGNDFVVAVNRTLATINVRSDRESRLSNITKNEGEISLDDGYEYVVADGVSLWLVKMGQMPVNDKANTIARLERDFEMGIDDIRQDIINQAQEADTDDDTTDTIGPYGALG